MRTMSACCLTVSLKSLESVMVETRLSAGIVRLRSADLNIPEANCCGEAVEAVLIPLIAEEKRVVIPREKETGLRRLGGSALEDPRYPFRMGEGAGVQSFDLLVHVVLHASDFRFGLVQQE